MAAPPLFIFNAIEEHAMAFASRFNSPLSANNLPDMANEAAEKAHDVVDRAAQTVKPVVNRLADAAHEKIDQVADKAAPAAEWMQTKAQRTSDSTLRLVDQCGSMVRERPIMTLAAAVAIGYFVGRIWR